MELNPRVVAYLNSCIERVRLTAMQEIADAPETNRVINELRALGVIIGVSYELSLQIALTPDFVLPDDRPFKDLSQHPEDSLDSMFTEKDRQMFRDMEKSNG